MICRLISKSVTYGCDDSPSEEEGAAHVPVAGVVGCVSAGTNSSTHGIYGVLDRPKRVSYHHQNPAHDRQNSRSCLRAGSADGIARARVDLERAGAFAHLLPMFTWSCVRECVMRLCNTPETTREDSTTPSDQRGRSRNSINEKEMQFHVVICCWIYWTLHAECRGVDPICHNTRLNTQCSSWSGLFHSSHWFAELSGRTDAFFSLLCPAACLDLGVLLSWDNNKNSPYPASTESFLSPICFTAEIPSYKAGYKTTRFSFSSPKSGCVTAVKRVFCLLHPSSNRLNSTGPSVLATQPSYTWPHSNQTNSLANKHTWDVHLDEIFTNSGDTHSSVQSFLTHGCTWRLITAHVMTSAPVQPW